jgi:RNA polymerase sigma-70 factor (ECF subfamily)
MKEQEQSNLDADYEVILRCQKGDVEAFEEIAKKYQKKMFNISYRLIGDYNEAAEVVQDAFVSAYRGLKGFKGKSRFSTWLYTIKE